MSTRKTLDQLSLEELKKREKMAKLLIIAHVVSIVILMATSIITTNRKGFGAFTMFPMFFIPILIAGINTQKQVKKEIELREREEYLQ